MVTYEIVDTITLVRNFTFLMAACSILWSIYSYIDFRCTGAAWKRAALKLIASYDKYDNPDGFYDKYIADIRERVKKRKYSSPELQDELLNMNQHMIDFAVKEYRIAKIQREIIEGVVNAWFNKSMPKLPNEEEHDD